MTSVLQFMGYGPVESLQFFLSRFKVHDGEIDLNDQLKNVWVCHKNVIKITQFQKNLNIYSYDNQYHNNHSNFFNNLKYPIQDNIQNVFKSSEIIKSLMDKLNCCLVQYIMTDCLLLYNWGINSFELIISNEEFNQELLKYHYVFKKRRKFVDVQKEFRKWRYLLTNQSEKLRKNKRLKENSDDLFEEEEKNTVFKSKRMKRSDFGKLRMIYQECDKPFQELPVDSNDPTQEIFTKDSILYDLKRKQWTRNHALMAESVDEMFSVAFRKKIRDKKNELNLTRSGRYEKLKDIFRNILKNHKIVEKYDGYNRILKRHIKNSGFHRIRSLRPVPTAAVCTYIIDILRKIVPFEFYESNNLRKKFFIEIARIISGEKRENFIFHSLTQIFLNSKESLPWLNEIQDWEVARRIILKVLKWLLLDYIFLILKNLFYVTDVGSSSYRLYYYKKNDMERAISLWLNSQLTKKNISMVKGNLNHWNSVERKWLETGVVEVKENEYKMKMTESTEYIYPVAKARFLPKVEKDGNFRVITSYRPKKTFLRARDFEKRKLVDMFMHRQVERVLKLRKVKFFLEFLVEKYGTGIKPLPGNPKLELAWIRAVHLKRIHGKLYFVKADISDAFGSVLPNLLDAIINNKLKLKDNRTMQMIKIKECRVKNSRIEPGLRKSFTLRPKENSILISRSIFIGEKKKLSSYKSTNLKFILDQIIYNQYLQINGKYYRIIKGLTQGSSGSFSHLLCEIYYSEMDRLYFQEFMTSSECIFLRGVDDYLLITSNIAKARKFYEIVFNGIADFNVSFSGGKLKSNINDDIPSVKYLGLIFNVNNMSVKPDYSKYEDVDILSTMKLNGTNKFFRKTLWIHNKASSMISLKLMSITLSDLYNSGSVVRETVYAASLIQTNKVLALTRHVFRAHEKNDLDIFVILSKSLGKITNLTLRHNKEISKDEITWLFWMAALNVFRKYSGLFPYLLTVIQYRLFVVENRSNKDGKAFILNCIRADMNCQESWRDLRQLMNIVTNRSKPSNRLK